MLVDIPKDVTGAVTEYVREEPEVIPRMTDKLREEDIDRALEMIEESKKPYIFVGGGAVISDADKELAEFVEKVQAPVTDSLMGKGAFDGTNLLYTGMLGMHGTKTSNYGVSECIF